MSKKVVFTEAQLKHILGEDVFNGVYMDMTSKGSEYPIDSIPATDGEVISTEQGGKPEITDKYRNAKTPDGYMSKTGRYNAIYEDNSKKKVVKNEKGEVVPETCPKCGSKVGLYIKGEPVYLCSNKKCNEYFGTKPFQKHLNERNAEMDGKKLFTAPKDVRKAAIPDGMHDEVLEKIRNGEPVSIEELYRWRTRGIDNPAIDRWVNQEIKMAQSMGASLRNNTTIGKRKNTFNKNTGKTNNGSTVYYENC